MPEAGSTMGGVSTGAPSSEAAVDPWSLTPEQAGAELDARSQSFAAQVPSPEQIQDVYDAQVRLAALTADPTWVRNFNAGRAAEVAEFNQLTQLIADAADETTPFVQAPAETTLGDQSARRQDLIATIEDLSKVGIPEEGVVRILTGDFPPDYIEWAQQNLDRCIANKEWTDALFRNDPAVLHEFRAWCGVIAAGKTT
jgi:hypothetical protein